MIKSFVSTVGVIYVILFAIVCHAVLMACRCAIKDPSSLTDELKLIADNIPHGCPEVSLSFSCHVYIWDLNWNCISCVYSSQYSYSPFPTTCSTSKSKAASIDQTNLIIDIFDSHPKVAEEFLRYAAQGLQGITCMFDSLLFSAYLLTYAENIAFL